MSLRQIIQGKETTKKDELIEQLQTKVKSLQETIDLQMEAVEAAQIALTDCRKKNRKLERKLERIRNDQTSDGC